MQEGRTMEVRRATDTRRTVAFSTSVQSFASTRDSDTDHGMMESSTNDADDARQADAEKQTAKEKMNYALLCRLLFTISPAAMQQVFNGIHAPMSLTHSLNRPQTQVILRRLHAHKVLTDDQWKMLFPGNKPASPSSSYDAVLLMTLLKAVCHLSAPYPNGWTGAPIPTDRSLGADLVRIKQYRSMVASNEDESIPQSDYNKLNKEICEVFERLGGNACRIKVDRLNRDALDDAGSTRFIKALQQWHSRAVEVEATEARVESLLKKRANDSELAMLSQADSPDGGKGSRNRSTSRSMSKTAEALAMKPEELKQHEKTVLQKFYKPLTETVNAEDVVTKLIMKGVLSHEEKNRINLATRNSDRMKMVLDILPNKPSAFDKFCDVIKYKYTSLQEQIVKAKQAPFVHDKPDGTTLVATALRSHYSDSYQRCNPLPWHHDVNVPLMDFIVPWTIADYNRQSIEPEDIFSSHDRCDKPRRVMIHGSSGSGKTLLASCLSYKWSKFTFNPRNQFKMVFNLDLRRARSDLVDTIIEQCLPESFDLDPTELHQVISENQQRVLFILDGYEYLHDVDSDVFDLIYKRLYAKSSVMLILDSHFITPVLSKTCDTKLTLQGLGKESQEDLVMKYAKITETPEESFAQLINTIRGDQAGVIKQMALNPFFCLAMCLIAEMKMEMNVSNETTLLHTFMIALQRLFCKRNLLQMAEESAPEEVNLMLTSFEELAYHVITSQHESYSCNELTQQFKDKTEAWLNIQPKDLFGFGILHVNTTARGAEMVEECSFTQNVLAEYLAASHLSHQESISNDSLNTFMSEPSLKRVLPLYSGICHLAGNVVENNLLFEALADSNTARWQVQPTPPSRASSSNSTTTDDSVKSKLEGFTSDLNLMLDCVSECQGQLDMLNIILQSLPQRLVMKNHSSLGLKEVYGLAHIISGNGDQLTELDIRLDHFGGYYEQAFLHLAESLSQNKFIDTLTVRWTDGDFMGLFLSTVFRKNKSITNLHITDKSKNQGDKISATLWSDLKSAGTNMSSVKSLAFSKCKNASLVTCFIANSPDTMQTLSLNYCNLDMLATQKLAGIIETTKTLTDLDLGNVKVRRADFVNITLSIRLNRTLTNLDLTDMDLDNNKFTALCEALLFNSSIKVLNLGKNILSDLSCKQLGTALKSSKNVKAVHLHECAVSEDGIYIMKNLKRSSVSLVGLDRRRKITTTSLFHSADAGLSLPSIQAKKHNMFSIAEEIEA